MTAVLMEILHYEGQRPGPVFLVLGGVHGNEPCGPAAIREIENFLARRPGAIDKGELIMVPEVNRAALKENKRFLDRDLNRGLGEVETPLCHEDKVANELCPLLQQADILLDLHAYGGGHKAFIWVGPENKEERKFAKALGVKFLCGGFQAATAALSTDNHAIGTTEYCRLHGGIALTLECGQKKDLKSSTATGKKAIINALRYLGMISEDTDQNPDKDVQDHYLVNVSKAYSKPENAVFTQNWSHLDRVKKGQVIAEIPGAGEIKADQDGFIVMPDHDADPDTEWFYFGVESQI